MSLSAVIGYLLKGYVGEWRENPSFMKLFEESYYRGLLGFGKEKSFEIGGNKILLGGVPDDNKYYLFEHHSHTHYSDGDDFYKILPVLFKHKISLWALTDHNSTEGFDGHYKLLQEDGGSLSLNGVMEKHGVDTGSFEYSLEKMEPPNDKKFMKLVRTNRDNTEEIVMMRAVELKVGQGDIYEGELNLYGIPYGISISPGTQFEQAIRETLNLGGYSIINHPYWTEGIAAIKESDVERAVNAGASAIEINGTEILLAMFSNARTMRLVEKYDIPLVSSGDSHTPCMYGKSGIAFPKEEFDKALKVRDGDYLGTIRYLIENRLVLNYFNPISPFRLGYLLRGDNSKKYPPMRIGLEHLGIYI